MGLWGCCVTGTCEIRIQENWWMRPWRSLRGEIALLSKASFIWRTGRWCIRCWRCRGAYSGSTGEHQSTAQWWYRTLWWWLWCRKPDAKGHMSTAAGLRLIGWGLWRFSGKHSVSSGLGIPLGLSCTTWNPETKFLAGCHQCELRLQWWWWHRLNFIESSASFVSSASTSDLRGWCHRVDLFTLHGNVDCWWPFWMSHLHSFYILHLGQSTSALFAGALRVPYARPIDAFSYNAWFKTDNFHLSMHVPCSLSRADWAFLLVSSVSSSLLLCILCTWPSCKNKEDKGLHHVFSLFCDEASEDAHLFTSKCLVETSNSKSYILMQIREVGMVLCICRQYRQQQFEQDNM